MANRPAGKSKPPPLPPNVKAFNGIYPVLPAEQPLSPPRKPGPATPTVTEAPSPRSNAATTLTRHSDSISISNAVPPYAKPSERVIGPRQQPATFQPISYPFAIIQADDSPTLRSMPHPPLSPLPKLEGTTSAAVSLSVDPSYNSDSARSRMVTARVREHQDSAAALLKGVCGAKTLLLHCGCVVELDNDGSPYRPLTTKQIDEKADAGGTEEILRQMDVVNRIIGPHRSCLFDQECEELDEKVKASVQDKLAKRPELSQTHPNRIGRQVVNEWAEGHNSRLFGGPKLWIARYERHPYYVLAVYITDTAPTKCSIL